MGKIILRNIQVEGKPSIVHLFIYLIIYYYFCHCHYFLLSFPSTILLCSLSLSLNLLIDKYIIVFLITTLLSLCLLPLSPIYYNNFFIILFRFYFIFISFVNLSLYCSFCLCIASTIVIIFITIIIDYFLLNLFFFVIYLDIAC